MFWLRLFTHNHIICVYVIKNSCLILPVINRHQSLQFAVCPQDLWRCWLCQASCGSLCLPVNMAWPQWHLKITYAHWLVSTCVIGCAYHWLAQSTQHHPLTRTEYKLSFLLVAPHITLCTRKLWMAFETRYSYHTSCWLCLASCLSASCWYRSLCTFFILCGFRFLD